MIKIIVKATFDAKKRLHFPLGTCFLYKILPPKVRGKDDIVPQVNVSSYVVGLPIADSLPF